MFHVMPSISGLLSRVFVVAAQVNCSEMYRGIGRLLIHCIAAHVRQPITLTDQLLNSAS